MSSYYCRLCSTHCEPEGSSLFSKQITEMILYCIPELEISLVHNPIICGSCLKLLHQTDKFKRKCLEVQNEIKKRLKLKDDTLETVNIPSNLYNQKDKNHTKSVTSNDSLFVSFNESYENPLTSSDSGRTNNRPEDAEVSAIMNGGFSEATKENAAEVDDLLNLLKSSSNMKGEIKPNILDIGVKLDNNSYNSYSNFYDDSVEVEMNSIPISEECPREQLQNTSTPKIVNNSKIKVSSLRNPLEVIVRNNFCETCGLKLPNFSSMITHLYTVHQERGDLYNCLLCRYKTSDIKCIKRHYQNIHRNCVDLKGSCIFCLTDACNYEELYAHMRQNHKSFCRSDRFRCSSCNFSTSKYDTFLRHFFRSHDFICNYCLTTCDSIELLNRHIGHHAAVEKRKNKV